METTGGAINVPVWIAPETAPGSCLVLLAADATSSCMVADATPGRCLAQEWIFDGHGITSLAEPTLHLGADVHGHCCMYLPSAPLFKWVFCSGYLLARHALGSCLTLLSDGSLALRPLAIGDATQQWRLDPIAIVEAPLPRVTRLVDDAANDALPTVDLASLSVHDVAHLLTSGGFPSSLSAQCRTLEINGDALQHCSSVNDLMQLGVQDAALAEYLWQNIHYFGRHGVPQRLVTPIVYIIQSVKDPRMCLHLISGDAKGAPNGDRCHLWTTVINRRHPAQEWLLEGPLIKSVKDTTKCIHLASGASPGTFNGDLCHLWRVVPGAHPAQEWSFDGQRILSAKDLTKCIHVASGMAHPSFNGDVCHLWDVQPGEYPAQEWTFVPVAEA
ncbi:hypothetical protein SDRG_02172 [Saprolegnia diclina VS20]|uniref:Uncharacterized protein n=1 Tax=Saprolegnia diclina (strain VS20) TaxID=1156394 RepID=T0S555_SAPDV|nr:hypothetical protein SDRG_02172 [Saprolegnia diclina VS20]EQC40268.1 hypothetical protein SDRG_02172 [Saprolegnia diclina VS20]|eukprot:XP_008605967.1 hypothetical protein SDRG_02172 [Saprolegnia diclina VS20]